jgi:hypothetical protein
MPSNDFITTTEAAGFIPEIWLGVALGRLRSYLTVQRTVTMDSDLETGAFQVGQVLHLPKRGALTVNDKTQNANYTVQNPSSSTIDLTLDHHKEVTFAVESRTVSTVNQDVIQGYVEDAAIAIAEQIDTDLFTLSASVPSEQSIPITAAGVPSTITEGAIPRLSASTA